jgi:SAM-dependent methyltransferase
VGIDLVEDLEQSDSHVLRGNVEHLPFADRSFDIICCRSVLEHVKDPELLFREISRCLRPGGTFIFLTPNRWDYVSLLARMIPNRWHPAIVQWLTGRASEDVFPTYYRANDVTTLRGLTARTGLKLQSISPLRQHPHYLGRFEWAYRVGIVLEAVQRSLPALRPWLLGVARR